MLQFIYSQFLFYFSIILVLFLPGYFLLRFIKNRKNIFSALEIFAFSLPLSLIITDFLMIILSRIGIAFSRISLSLIFLAFILMLYGLDYYAKKKYPVKLSESLHYLKLDFTRRQMIIILLILTLSFVVRIFYLSNSVLPTATDLGHHMYWSKVISQTGKVPVYEERDILSVGNQYSLSDPQPIADFIVGEHLPFAALNLIGGMNFISSSPMAILLLINLMALLVFLALALLFFSETEHRNYIVIFLWLAMGPLYSLSTPQAKFVSGGVIGNVIGNLFIPVALYFLYRALSEKNRLFFALFIFTVGGLIFTHHLSTLILIFIILFSIIIHLAFNFKKIKELFSSWLWLFFGKIPLLTLFFILIMILFFYTPTYLNFSAVNTAIGTPEKNTRLGLTLLQLAGSNSPIKVALALSGLILIIIWLRKKINYRYSILLGWIGSILVMALRPNWLFIDIPSDRVAAYAFFPLTILAAYVIVQMLANKKKFNSTTVKFLGLLLMIYVFYSGLTDNASSTKTSGNNQKAYETFLASRYLSQRTNAGDGILKDHNYLIADSWIKLYFMRGYNYPLSRGYFKRYDDQFSNRERCTLEMISAPDSENAQRCFQGTATDYVMVNGRFDSAQFYADPQFNKIYDSGDVTIFMKN
jgi:hypothetical protein